MRLALRQLTARGALAGGNNGFLVGCMVEASGSGG